MSTTPTAGPGEPEPGASGAAPGGSSEGQVPSYERPPTWGAAPSSNQPSPNQPSYGQPSYGQPSYGTPGAPADATGGPAYAGAGGAWGAGGSEVLGDEPPPAETSTGGGRGRRWAPWIIGGAVVAVVGGGAFAVQAALGGGGPQPAEAIPADAVMYARLDLDPSGTQKIAALRFANKFPGFGDLTGIRNAESDIRERIFDELLSSSPELRDVSYEADIEPWLGSRVGFALMPSADGGVSDSDVYVDPMASGVVLTLQVTDQEAAEAGLGKLFGAEEGAAPAGVAFSGDYALIAVTQELADEYAAAAAENPLSADEEFQADMESLGDPGVASMWISGDAMEAMAEAEGTDLSMFESLDLAGLQGNQTFALRFDDRYAEIAFVQSGSDMVPADEDTGESPITGLPDSTVFAAGVANGDALVGQYWESFTELTDAAGAELDAELQSFEDSTGLAIPDDIATLMGDNFVLALDGDGLEDFMTAGDPSALRIGALLDTDTAAAEEILDEILAALGGGFPLESVESDGLLAVSPNADYAAELTSGDLGSSEIFTLAVPDAANAEGAMFLSIDALEDMAFFDDLALDPTVAENLAPLQSIGASYVIEDGEMRGSFRVVAGG